MQYFFIRYSALVNTAQGNNHCSFWDRTKSVTALYGQNAVFLDIKAGGTYKYHCALKW
jgi:hypothetical protein